MSERVKDMTKGRPAGLIWNFALPLMIGNIFQQLYTTVDAIVVGQGVGVKALAALGSADWPNFLIVGMVLGFTQGFSVRISQKFGAEDWQGLRKTAAMTIRLAILIAAVSTVLSLVFSRQILLALHTDPEVLEGALLYLRIIFAGIPIIMGYNTFASILRALGDSRTPLNAMILASCVNIGLDLLFVCVFRWGIFGAGFATVLAQLCSCIFCGAVIHRIGVIHFSREEWKFDWKNCWDLICLGSPTSFQNAVIGIGGMFVQYAVNGCGFLFVAGFTAANKLYGILEIAASSFGCSMSTYVGQNLGARRMDRIRAGMTTALKMALLTAAVIGGGMLLAGKPILSLFISGTPEQAEKVMEIAYVCLACMCIPLPVLYTLWVYRSALMGLGDTLTPMVSGMVELAMRLTLVLLMPRFWGTMAVFLAEPGAWLGAVFLLVPAFYVQMHRLKISDSK